MRVPIAYCLNMIAKPGRSLQYTPEYPFPGPMGWPRGSVTSGRLDNLLSSSTKSPSMPSLPPNICAASQIIPHSSKTDPVEPCLINPLYTREIVEVAVCAFCLPSNRYFRFLMINCCSWLCRYVSRRAALAHSSVVVLPGAARLWFIGIYIAGIEVFWRFWGIWSTKAEANPDAITKQYDVLAKRMMVGVPQEERGASEQSTSAKIGRIYRGMRTSRWGTAIIYHFPQTVP